MSEADSSDRAQQDPHDHAHFDFHERFHASCSLDRLDAAAKDRLGWIFEQTVGHAIAAGLIDWENEDEPREFALDRVEEIATLANQGMCNNVVTEAVLTMAAEKVIYFWQARCLTMQLRFGRLRIFCVGYPE